jgi:hypothetical protein
MAIKTQTTQLFIINPTEPAAVLEVGQVTDIEGIDAPISAVESTTLASDHREYTPGIAEPASATFKVQFDPKDSAQATLHSLRNAGTQLHWAVGFSDGSVSPTIDDVSDGFDDTAIARSFIYFDGFMTTFDFGAAINGVVSSSVGVQLTNKPSLVVSA